MALNTDLKTCHCKRENKDFQCLNINIPVDGWSKDDATLISWTQKCAVYLGCFTKKIDGEKISYNELYVRDVSGTKFPNLQQWIFELFKLQSIK